MPLLPSMRVGFGVEVRGELPLTPARLQATRESLAYVAMSAASYVKGTWIALANHLEVGAEYIAGIQEQEVLVIETEDRLTVSIEVINTAESARWVEEGHEGYHLPSRIDWSRTDGSIKRNPRTGKAWLTVPFRHRAYASPSQQAAQGLQASTVRAMMPSSIYRAAAKLERSVRLNQGVQRDRAGNFLAADRYLWGDRLTRVGPRGVGGPFTAEEFRPHWTASKYEGMVRFEQLKKGGSRDSVYLTFRTLTPHSKGWHIPAKPGKHIARRVAQHTMSGSGRAYVNNLLREALRGAMGE